MWLSKWHYCHITELSVTYKVSLPMEGIHVKLLLDAKHGLLYSCVGLCSNLIANHLQDFSFASILCQCIPASLFD